MHYPQMKKHRNEKENQEEAKDSSFDQRNNNKNCSPNHWMCFAKARPLPFTLLVCMKQWEEP